MSALLASIDLQNARAITIFTSYLLICTSLTLLILRDLYRQHSRGRSAVMRRSVIAASLVSSRGTSSASSSSKEEEDDDDEDDDDDPDRKDDAAAVAVARSATRVQIFGALAAVSLAVTWFYMFAFFALSYRSWAFGKPEPEVRTGAAGIQTLRLGPWLKDVQLFRDAWEVVLETGPRLFWSQPIFFITAAWSIFLGIETHRRKIPHSWAYMVLGQIVAISFAQNLFFLAVLLFPVSRGRRNPASKTAPSKPATWTPPRALYGICVLLTFLSVAAVPWVTGTGWFMRVLVLPHVVLVVPSVLHAVTPVARGIRHASLTDADAYLRPLYQLAFWLALYSQLKVGAEAVFFPPAGAAVHRHANVLPPLPDSGGAFGPLRNALYEHPAVSSVGWDVLLCSLSFVCWRITGMINDL